jgi:hypothetical protein
LVSIQRRSLVSPWVVGVYVGVLGVTAGVALFSDLPLDLEGGPLSFLDAFLIFVMAGLLLALGIGGDWRTPKRAGYVLGTVLALGIGIIQLVGLLDGETPVVEELDTGNTLCWLIAGAFLVWMLRSSGRIRTAERFLILGFVLQSFSLVADVTDGMFVELPDLFDWLFGPGEEISEVLFLATYCCGFTLLADRSTAEAIRWRQEGVRAWDMLEPAVVIKRAGLALHWRFGGWGERLAMAAKMLATPAWFCGELLWQVARNGQRIRTGFNKSRLRQGLEAVRLGIGAGVPAVNYYKFDLFADDNDRLAPHFLHQHTLSPALDINWLFAQLSGAAIPANGRIELSGHCPLHGWPQIGARPQAIVSAAQALHPALRQLTGGAAASVLILSCLDEAGVPEITHAVLRMARLGADASEDFHCGGVGAAVDLADGKLGWATDLGLGGSIGWIPAHPDSNETVAERTLPLWREARALALLAHQQRADCTVAAWDIALLADGARLIGGNGVPDFDLVQRIHARPLGLDRLGRLMAYHLRSRLL